MGYLAEKQKKDFETFGIIKVKDIEGISFRITSVHIADIDGKFGMHHTAVCNIIIDSKPFTVFVDKEIVVETLESGIKDGHDWNDNIEYVIIKRTKKTGQGHYWMMKEAVDEEAVDEEAADEE